MKLRIIAMIFVVACAQALFAQTWTISTVVDNTTPCSATAFFNPLNLFPAINGPWVVFVDAGDDNCTTGNGQSLWSYNLITNTFTMLADTSTLVPPANTYTFEAFATESTDNLQVYNGTVLFYAYDAGSNSSCYGGLYTVPAGGGTIYRVVDYTQKLPGYGGYFCGLNTSYGINGLLGMSLTQDKIVFSATGVATGKSANGGVWWATPGVNTAESDLHRIADFGTTYQSSLPGGCSGSECYTVNTWAGANIEGTTTAFTGGDPNGLGLDGLFVNTYKGAILLSDVILPGDTGADPSRPDQSSGYVGPVVDGDNIFFIGSDPWYEGSCAGGAFAGIFEVGTKGGTVTSIMNTCNTQPNGDSLTADSFTQLAANGGIAVFPVTDSVAGDVVLDSSVNGTVSVLLAPLDPLPSGASCGGAVHDPGCATAVSPPGTDAVNGGRIVFAAEGGPYWYDEGIYVASLPCASMVSGVSVTLGTLKYDSSTGIWSQTATVKNTSTQTITGPLSLVLANLSGATSFTDGNGTTVCFAPAGSPYINFILTDNELAPKKTSKVTLDFSAPSNADITFTSEVASAGAR